MAFDLFTALFALGVRFTLVPGVMLFIVSLGRDAWNAFLHPNRTMLQITTETDSAERLGAASMAIRGDSVLTLGLMRPAPATFM